VRDGLYFYICIDGGAKSREEKVSLDGGSLWTQGGTLAGSMSFSSANLMVDSHLCRRFGRDLIAQCFHGVCNVRADEVVKIQSARRYQGSGLITRGTSYPGEALRCHNFPTEAELLSQTRQEANSGYV
jgi:hypothetical protein